MKKEKVLAIIPARLASTRLPRKMLLSIKGKTVIQRTWEQVMKAKTPDAVVIATDSEEIFAAAKAFGANVVMTSVKHQCGSDRVVEATKKFKEFIPDIIVNVQGDEPVISPHAIDDAVSMVLGHKNVKVGTVASTFDNQRDVQLPNYIKVALDKNNNALYCSRSVIPFARNSYTKYYKQLGVYAFRRKMLYHYLTLPQTPLELAEGLEQLRILENGYKIAVATGTYESLSIDTPIDLAKARRYFAKK